MTRGGGTCLFILIALLVGNLFPQEKQRLVPVIPHVVIPEYQPPPEPPPPIAPQPIAAEKRSSELVRAPVTETDRVVPLEILVVQASKLNVRSEPSPSAAKAGQLTKNAVVSVLRSSGDFVYIVSEGQRIKGWVNRSFLGGKAPATTAHAPVTYQRPVVVPIVRKPVQKPQPQHLSGFSHKGKCACPDDVDSIGRRCGKRSAYSRAGGASPTCNGRRMTLYEAPAPKAAPSYSGTCGGTGYGSVSCLTGAPKTTYVRGYRRKDGTYVRPHYRSKRR
jgi:hypothetical protein